MKALEPVDWEDRASIIKTHASVKYRKLIFDYFEALANAEKTKDFLVREKVDWATLNQYLMKPLLYALLQEAVKRGEVYRQRLREEEADRRAVEGVDQPVFQQGRRVGYIRKYSDQLLALQLKAGNPDRYADRQQIEHRGAVLNLNVEGVTRDLEPDACE